MFESHVEVPIGSKTSACCMRESSSSNLFISAIDYLALFLDDLTNRIVDIKFLLKVFNTFSWNLPNEFKNILRLNYLQKLRLNT